MVVQNRNTILNIPAPIKLPVLQFGVGTLKIFLHIRRYQLVQYHPLFWFHLQTRQTNPLEMFDQLLFDHISCYCSLFLNFYVS